MEEQISKLLNKTFILGAVLVAGIIVFLFSQIGYQQKYLEQQNNYQITVSGEGKVYVKPDIAIVSLGVIHRAPEVSIVLSKTTDKINAIIKAVKDLGIEEKDIQTTQYTIAPEYNWNKEGVRIFNGYVSNQSIEVKIRDFAKIGSVLQKATDNGANNVGDLQFTIENPEQFKQEARVKAIEQAKTKAKSLAKDSGVALGKLINVSEVYNYPMYGLAKGMGGGEDLFAPAPTIEPGQQGVSVTINLTYRVK